MKIKIAVFAVSLALGVAHSVTANATILRVDFSGRVLFYLDEQSGAVVQSAVGTTFAGFLLYDVDNPEYSSIGLNEYGQPTALVSSASGCSPLTNGACVNDEGANAPIVLDYGFTYSQVDYSPLSSMLGYRDGSQLHLQSAGGAPSGERWAVVRNQNMVVLTGDPAGDYAVSLSKREIAIVASITGDGLLDDPASNLTQGFNFGAIPTGQGNFTFRDLLPSTTACTYGGPCDWQYGIGSFYLYGTLTDVAFRVVPEPTTLALLGLGLVGLAITRSNRQRLTTAPLC